jgi:ABC-type metal ion transport system substrate-binding protein
MICVLALNLVTFASPTEEAITINTEDVVSLTVPHHGYSAKVKCIINLIDGKHVALGIDCEEVKRRLKE